MLTSFTSGELLEYYSFALVISVAKISISNTATMAKQLVLNGISNAVSSNRLDGIEKYINTNTFLRTEVDVMQTAVNYAIAYSKLDALKILLSRGLFSNFALSEFLYECIKYNRLDMVKYLIKKGANVCKPFKSGQTPLYVAVNKENIEIVEVLINNGAKFTIHSALPEAVKKGNSKIIELLVQNGANVNILTVEGTPLINAINKGMFELVQIIVQNQADVNQCDKNGNYPITRALELRNNEIVKMLVENNVKLDIVDKSGDTPLIKAVRMSNREAVQYFIERGVDVNQKDQTGECVLSIALSEDDFSMFELLIQSGANPDLASESIKAKASENPDFARYVSKIIEIKNEKGLTGQEAAN